MANSSDTGDDAKRRLRLARPTSYQVGYGKPPVTTRFKPGQSGNPKGRPRGARNRLPALNEERLKGIILQEAYRTIKVREGEKNITVPIATAVVRAVAVNAAKGNNRAALLFTQMVRVVEDQNKALHDEWLNTAIEYKVKWEREIARCKRSGLEPPRPIPHPDQIHIDMSTGQVRIYGPFTKEDLPKWEEFRQRKAECDREIALIKSDLADPAKQKYRQQLLDDLAHEEQIRFIICKAIPD